MESRDRFGIGIARRAAGVSALLLGATLLGGCLGEPEIEDRWTRIDLESTSLTPYQSLPPGPTPPISVRAAITYRSILTGFAVAELRASGTLSATDVVLHPDASRERMAQDIDHILQNSVTMGRATRAVTGWDHLIQHIDFNFTGVAPVSMDSAGVPIGPATGLFLVCYLGEGEEIELANGDDSLVVTPFNSAQYEILPVGLELTVATPGNR